MYYDRIIWSHLSATKVRKKIEVHKRYRRKVIEFNNKYQCEITSAKQLIGVDKAFKTIANMIIKSKQELEALEIKSLREFKADKTLNNKEKTKKCC